MTPFLLKATFKWITWVTGNINTLPFAFEKQLIGKQNRRYEGPLTENKILLKIHLGSSEVTVNKRAC